MSHSAYEKTQRATQNPRELEYRAFCEATARLERADADGRADLKMLIDAIHFNRQLWGALAADCRRDDNGLPVETRRSIVSLTQWVSDYSSSVMREGEAIAPLVEINRMMMDGLSGKAA
ncbi:MAG: flagellar biosynthesis regulator FlaF [Pseudomonadota bacterium]